MRIHKQIEYYCSCGAKITQQTKLYKSGLCASCSHKGKHYIRSKKPWIYFCLDCKKKISYGKTRCRSCNVKYLHKMRILDNRKEKIISYCQCGDEKDKRARTCQTCFLKTMKNEGNPAWLGGTSRLPYAPEWSDDLRESIRKQDDYTCQNCGMTEEEHIIVFGQVLHVHHIDYNKQNCKEYNLITLCLQCNVRANKNRDYWKSLYQEKKEKEVNVQKPH